MTEEEWLDTTSPGTVLEGVRRRVRYRAGVVGRKARLAACEILRLVVPQLGNPSWLEPIELTERYVDGSAGLSEIEAAIDEADEVQLTPTQTTRRALRLLTKPDPFAAANDAPWIAGHFLGLPPVARLPIGTDPQLQAAAVAILRDIFCNPFRPVAFDPNWRTSTAVALARGMYESRDFGAMPILADALQDAGCENADILNHCRDAKHVHVRGCWVVDLVLGKA
jgi:hypothetical protein